MAEELAGIAESTPLAVRVHKACRLAGIGRSKLYELIATGEIRIIKVGSIAPIPFAGLQQVLDRKTVRYLGVDIQNALALAEGTEV